jgi:aminoglycoside phosphotransferase (APT) family kinase protein
MHGNRLNRREGNAMAGEVYDKGRDLEGLVGLLAGWLTSKLGARAQISGVHCPTGSGASNETILFSADWIEGSRACHRDLVLRIHPREEFQLFLYPRFRAQFDLLGALSVEGRTPVPGVLWFEDDIAILGQQFFVMERVAGRVPDSHGALLSEIGPSDRRRLWERSIHQLAHVHQTPVAAVSFLRDPSVGITSLDQYLAETTSSLEWAAGHSPDPAIKDVMRWLYENVPAEPTLGLAWGDARLGNLMFDDDFEVVAVLDWEQASLAGGLTDLGWWLYLDEFHRMNDVTVRPAGLGSREETISLWQELTGQSTRDLLWYEVFAGIRVCIVSLRGTQLRGMKIDGPLAEINPYLKEVCRRLELAPPVTHRG